MIPEFAEIAELEKKAASKLPDKQGAWWIMLQTAKSIINNAEEYARDPVNNSVLDEFWTDVAGTKRISQFLQLNGNRPQPYDDLMQMISYCGDQLEKVFKNPRQKLIKEDKMVTPNRLKNSTQKTMNWLGKQPGKTIREKVADKHKILTQVNVYSCDVKENQVALALYKQLSRRTKARVEYGINAGSYDSDYSSPNIKKMRDLKKILRDSDLKEIMPVNHTVANNVLLGDKNYSVIWSAYLDMCKYDKNLSKDWEVAKELYVKSIFISAVSMLLEYQEVKPVDERINLDGYSEESITFIIGDQWDNPMIVEVEYEKNIIHLRIDDYYCNTNERIRRANYILKYNDGKVSDVIPGRGYPLKLEVTKGNNKEARDILADNEGINDCLDWMLQQITKEYGNELYQRENSTIRTDGTLVFDILSDGKYSVVNGEIYIPNFCNKSVSYTDEKYGKRTFIHRDNCVYKGYSEKKYIHNAVDDDPDTSALMYTLEDIRNTVSMGQKDYLIYLVPDSLEELLQRNLKQCIYAWFPRERTFPVWRSVAALTDVITNTDSNLKDDDFVLSIDIMGDSATVGLLSVSFNDDLNGLICNHYPPIPQNDEGDYVTERAFFTNYVAKYLLYRKEDIEPAICKDIAESGLVEEVILQKKSRNYIDTSNGIRMIQINYDENILTECIRDFISDFRRYWKKIERRLPEKPIVYVNMLSDCLLNCLTGDEMNQINEIIGDSIGETYKSYSVKTSREIADGAYIYKSRINNNLPKWTEYLPKLSLRVLKDGQFESLDLIGDGIGFEIMGDANEYPVPKPLLLAAGRNSYSFPLKKEDVSKKRESINANLIDKSFPLEKDTIVQLTVRYKYGYENSYELVVSPLESVNAPFHEITVEWTTGETEPKEEKYPLFPVKSDEEYILRSIEILEERFARMENTIEYYMEKYAQFKFQKFDWDRLNTDLIWPIFRIRSVIVHHELQEVDTFISNFYNRKLSAYLGEISEFLPNVNYISHEFFNDYGKSAELNELKSNAYQLLFAFGAKCPMAAQRRLLDIYDSLRVQYKQSIMYNMFFLNSDNDEIINQIIGEASLSDKKMEVCIKGLSSLCWFDERMIFDLYRYPAFVDTVIKHIENEFYEWAYSTNTQLRITKGSIRKYTRYIEMILAILRLRENDGFDKLKVDSKEARELDDAIQIVDDKMEHPESKIRLKVDKPEALRNMSDIAFAVHMYLTGDEGVDAIEVVSIEEE